MLCDGDMCGVLLAAVTADQLFADVVIKHLLVSYACRSVAGIGSQVQGVAVSLC